MPRPRAASSTASIRTSASPARPALAQQLPGRATVTVPTIAPSATATSTTASSIRDRPSSSSWE